jgi:hypothetical protein
MLGSNPGQLRLRHWLSDALTTRLDLIHHWHYWARYKSRCFKVHFILPNTEIRWLVANINSPSNLLTPPPPSPTCTSNKFSLGCLWSPPFLSFICMSEEEGTKKPCFISSKNSKPTFNRRFSSFRPKNLPVRYRRWVAFFCKKNRPKPQRYFYS